MAITAVMEMITPQIAQEYLTHNTSNYRFLSTAKVSSYAEDMKHGLWKENGESIVFGADGTLRNGQHRLNAIVKSGVTIPILVVRGVQDDVSTFDVGMGRTISQICRANGYAVGTDMVGAARMLVGGFHNSAPKGLVQQYIEDHYQDLHESALIARRGHTHPIGKKASCCLAVYVSRRLELVNDSILEDFFSVFNSGTITPNQARDPSPALIASRAFITKLNGGNASATIKQFVTLMQAFDDFRKNKNRKNEYKTDVTAPIVQLDHLRKLDGFNEG